jgi:uncharacterized membrane protein YkvA (DUF1232 family)
MKISIKSIYNWYRDLIRNPKYRWWVILGTLLYFVSPFDISPDFLPIAGQIDDVFLLTLLVSEVSQVVIEGFKARKTGIDTTVSETADPSSSTTTVDVDAVSMK